MGLNKNALDEFKPLNSRSTSELSTSKKSSSSSIDLVNQINYRGTWTMPKREHIFIFLILVYSMTFYGAGSSIFGLSIIEFSKNLNSSIEQISYGLTLSYIFGTLGSLLATYSLDRFNRQLQFCLSNLILAINYLVFAFLTSLPLYFVNLAVNGFIIPFMNIIPSVWITELFQKSGKTYLQIMHVFMPIGQMIGPTIFIPFMKHSNSTEILKRMNETSLDGDSTYFDIIVDTLFSTAKYSNLWIPFLIVCVLKTITSILVGTAYLIKPYRKPIEDDDSMKDEKIFDLMEEGKKSLSKTYLAIFVLLISLLTACQMANENNFLLFISAYLQKSDLKLDESAAAYVQGSLSTANTCGRIINIFLTMFISTQTMLFINFFFMIAGNCILKFSGTLTGVYCGTILLGYGFSNCLPMLVGFVDERVTMRNKIMSLMNLSGAILNMSSLFLLGRILDTHAYYFTTYNLVITMVAFSIYCLLVVIERFRLSKLI